MKKKFISLKKYQEIIKPREELSYSDESPFDPITRPPTNIFIAWHGPEALIVNDSTGTAYVCRRDDYDSKPLNFDVYSIRPTKNPDIIEITISPKQEYHWAENIPKIMEDSVPEWIKEKIKKIIKKN